MRVDPSTPQFRVVRFTNDATRKLVQENKKTGEIITLNLFFLRPLSPEDPYSYSKDKISEVRYPIRCGPNQFTSYLKG